MSVIISNRGISLIGFSRIGIINIGSDFGGRAYDCSSNIQVNIAHIERRKSSVCIGEDSYVTVTCRQRGQCPAWVAACCKSCDGSVCAYGKSSIEGTSSDSIVSGITESYIEYAATIVLYCSGDGEYRDVWVGVTQDREGCLSVIISNRGISLIGISRIGIINIGSDYSRGAYYCSCQIEINTTYVEGGESTTCIGEDRYVTVTC